MSETRYVDASFWNNCDFCNISGNLRNLITSRFPNCWQNLKLSLKSKLTNVNNEMNSLQTLTKSNDAEMQKCNKNIQTRRYAKYAMNMITNNSRTPNVEPNKCNLYHSWLCSILPYFAVVWLVWFSYPSSTLKLFEVI